MCINCKSKRILSISAKCDDRCFIDLHSYNDSNYVPKGIGLGNSSDYIKFSYCLDCGILQDTFPLPVSEFEANILGE